MLLIAIFNQWENPTAWVYWGLHGSYGVLWVLKSRLFPDKNWEARTGISYGLVIWGGLSLYWIAPYIITSQAVNAPPWLLGGCVALYGVGVFLHFTADMQKYWALRLRPNTLITEGVWRWCRNPNYLGELLIYLSFALLALYWVPLIVVLLFVLVVWLPNMRRKDRSLSRYPEFADYRQRTKRLIPYLW
ncbi:MAG: DUF1295 domain-containing protein [Chloroflexi bacterium]|nr:MAG: DUF1295 domain-containing protein [Chloroflexota bacterium]